MADPRYAVHPAVAHARAMIANLEPRTGRPLEAWLDLLRAEAPDGDRERLDWLRGSHGLGGATARLIVELAAGRGAADTDPDAYLRAAPALVDALYAGRNAALRPLHDAVVEAAMALGPDVAISPCRTIVPVYRRHVLAEVRPATRTRLDLGLALGDAPGPLPARLVPTGGAERGDRITHRVGLTGVADLDAEVRRWLRTAYELDA